MVRVPGVAYPGAVKVRAVRAAQRGATLVLLMIVFVGLAAIAGLTAISVQGGAATSNHDRFTATARYAAESGGAAAMVYLRANLDPTTGFSALVTPGNTAPVSPAGIAGNNVAAGATGNLMSSDIATWYSVSILNNRSDPGFAGGHDHDTVVIIRSTGNAPNGAVAIIEWEVWVDRTAPPGTPLTLLGWRQIL